VRRSAVFQTKLILCVSASAPFRTWRYRGRQVPHLPRSARGRRDELCRQHRSQEPVRDRRARNPWSPEPSARRWRRRHVRGHRQEGKARAPQEGECGGSKGVQSAICRSPAYCGNPRLTNHTSEHVFSNFVFVYFRE